MPSRPPPLRGRSADAAVSLPPSRGQSAAVEATPSEHIVVASPSLSQRHGGGDGSAAFYVGVAAPPSVLPERLAASSPPSPSPRSDAVAPPLRASPPHRLRRTAVVGGVIAATLALASVAGAMALAGAMASGPLWEQKDVV